MGSPLVVVTVVLLVVALATTVVASVASYRRLRVRLESEVSSGPEQAHEPEGLREAEAARARLAGALEAVSQGVVVRDEAGREVFRNQAALAYVRGRHGEALVEQAIQEQFAALAEGGALRRTLDLYGPPRRVLLLSAVTLGDGPHPAGALVLVDDVSERRRLEAVRRDFVTNITHELKTPVGALGLLADTISVEDDAEVVRRLAARMTEEALRVGRIIDDLLDLSRIEAEEAPRHEPVPVHEVVSEAVERVRPLAQRRGIQVDTSDVVRSHAVRGDRRQLMSAVANLLENACKYSEEGSPVELRSRVEGEMVEVEVRDQGIGIPGRDLERVFERFYRVDRARSRETGGTGLGLAIVRHVATNHKGEVRVTSREGEGSVFTLRLPSAFPSGGPVPSGRVVVPVEVESR